MPPKISPRHQPFENAMGRTLYDKIFDEHVIHTEDDGTAVLYIDRHLGHEATSPHASKALRRAGRKLRPIRPVVAPADHNTPPDGWDRANAGLAAPISKQQL